MRTAGGGLRDFADVATPLPWFIEEVHNAEWLYSELGYRPPDEFESRQRSAGDLVLSIQMDRFMGLTPDRRTNP